MRSLVTLGTRLSGIDKTRTKLRRELNIIKSFQSCLSCGLLGFFLGAALTGECKLLDSNREGEDTVRRLALTPRLLVLQGSLHFIQELKVMLILLLRCVRLAGLFT